MSFSLSPMLGRLLTSSCSSSLTWWHRSQQLNPPMARKSSSAAPALARSHRHFLQAQMQSCILLLELPLGWGLTYYRNSCSSSSWRLYPGAHYHHCRGLGCCSEQSCWLFLYELQHKVPCPLAASVSCTFSCLYPEDQHVRPEHRTLSHRRVGKKTTNTMKISIFCSEVFPHSCPCSDFWDASMQEMPWGQ